MENILGQQWPQGLALNLTAGFITIALSKILSLILLHVRLRYIEIRSKLILIFVAQCVLTLIFVEIGVNIHISILGPWLLSVFTAWKVTDTVAKVGILNAFSSTSDGISAGESLALVQRSFDFLGVGARKLTQSPEFKSALKRCHSQSGRIRFLLTDPANEGLSDLAKKNGKNPLAYKILVQDSIREIFHSCKEEKVEFEVRLYSLSHEFALPHFRLMMVDEQKCIFSYVDWNASEGLDNPQIVLAESKNGQVTLFSAYKKYYEELWCSPSSRTLDSAEVDQWTT